MAALLTQHASAAGCGSTATRSWPRLPEARRLAHRRHAAAAAAAASRRRLRPCSPPAASSSEAGSSGSGSSAAAAAAPAAPVPTQLAGILQADPDDEIQSWAWTGSDEFTPLGDRLDAPALPLPHLPHSQRIVLVRHGQSTWNARNRIQGSSNFSVLTEKGMEQAATARKLLAGWDFQALFVSPLKRAFHTGQIVWGGRPGPVATLPALREVDLYSFQGLDKLENRSLYPEQAAAWASHPANFEIDGHAPVRELWYRSSLAWHQVLAGEHAGSQVPGGASLVVAHNAVNQALLCTALGLPPSFFRRFSQSNAAVTVVDFSPNPDGKGPPLARIERVNQFPDRPMNPRKLGRSSPNRLVMVCGPATSPAVQAALAMLTGVGVTTPPLIGIGAPEQQALDINTAMQAALSTPGDGRTVMAVASPEACQRLLGMCLGPLDPQAPEPERAASAAAVGAMFEMSEGGITIVSWPQGQGAAGRSTVLCVNYQLPPDDLLVAAEDAEDGEGGAAGDGGEAEVAEGGAAEGDATTSGDGF